MGFLMDGLDAEAYDRKYKDGQLLKRIGGYFRPTFHLMIIVAILVVTGSSLDAVSPILISSVLDKLASSQLIHIVILLVSFILLAAVLSWVCNMFRQRLSASAVGSVVLQLRKDAFSAVMSRDMSFFDEFVSGKIISRVTSDTEEFATVVTLTLNLLSQVLLFVIIVVVLIFKNWYLALLTFTITPAIVAVALGFRNLARVFTQRAQRSIARVNANVQEVVNGITIAKNFRQEQNMYDEFKRVNAQSYHVDLRTGFLYNGVFPVLIVIANLGTTIVVYFGGNGVAQHTISAGDWFLFVQSIALLWSPLVSIASFWSQFQLGLSASERVFALLDAEPRISQIAEQPVPRLKGEITFEHVFFSYDDRQTVLTDFNLHINAGETVAFVGHTGAGKTSIARLMARFYEFLGGQILVDGRDIRSLNLHEYHQRLGIVPQVPFLFSGTIAENIRYARLDASDEEVEAAAQRIGSGDWLEALPEGLQTVVGEAGRALSMGQRQLVALARVLLQDPSIIVLDEATASIDPLTETQIQEGLDTILKGRTSIVIAHRLSTVRNADRIIVLRQGRIVEQGNHQALLKRGGHYAELYNTYFRHQSPDYRPGEGFTTVVNGDVEKTDS